MERNIIVNMKEKRLSCIMRKDWKSPWYWLCLALMVVWAFFLVEGTGMAVMPHTTHIWCILLAILSLAIHFISKTKLDPPILVRYQMILTVGLYLFYRFFMPS